MIMVGAMVAVLWGIGAAMGAPRQARWTMTLLLIVAVMMVQVALPDGHPLREATGGDVRLWALILGFGAVAYAYKNVLGVLRLRAEAQNTAVKATNGSFSNTELTRYARHITLREIGGSGQKALGDAKVLVVGAGGLGSPVLQYLGAAGVGTIGVIDDDLVESSNLQRQIIHLDAQIGAPKVLSAADAIVAQNPFVTVRPYHRRLTEEIAVDLFADYDLIIDGTDGFDTRSVINRAAVETQKPFIAGALTQWEGQAGLYDAPNGGPCYACVFPTKPDPVLVPTCAEAGVAGPLPGIIGSIMATEAVKHITGAGETLKGRLLIYDALYAEMRIISVKRNPDCAVCGHLA